MLVCDICKKEITRDGERLELPYEFVNGAWQLDEFDLCEECVSDLRNAIAKAKADFVNRGADND